MDKRSPLNTGRTLARNRRKQARHVENVAYRSALHMEKVRASDPNATQKKIDEISKRK